jgi:hypothetical protein
MCILHLTVFGHVMNSTKVMPLIFFSVTCSYSFNEIYICHGYILYKIEVIFPQSVRHLYMRCRVLVQIESSLGLFPSCNIYMMDKVQKKKTVSVYYTPSSKPYSV